MSKHARAEECSASAACGDVNNACVGVHLDPALWGYAQGIVANDYTSVFKPLVPNDLSCCSFECCQLSDYTH